MFKDFGFLHYVVVIILIIVFVVTLAVVIRVIVICIASHIIILSINVIIVTGSELGEAFTLKQSYSSLRDTCEW